MKPSKYTRSYLFDGVKAQSIENMDYWMDKEISSGGDTHNAYAAVPVVYRCVQLRANAIARVPCYITRNEEPVDYPLEYLLPRLLWLTEAALCIYGAAYWLRAMNRARVEGFRWLLPPSIKILVDEVKGLTGFERKVGTQRITYTPEQLVYFWLPALDKEIGPGVSPVQAALTMAGVSQNANEFASAFFGRGAIPATLLTIEGNPPDTELRRLEAWWKKLLSGVQRAWETVAVRAGVTVQTIQPPIKDLAMVELNDVSRRQVAMALGVPVTLLEDAANYSTASTHHVQFYTETIAPECDLLTEILNAQVFKPQGMEIVLAVNELDVMQADESERSGSLKQLHEAGLPLVLAMQMLGYDLPEGWTYERLERELAEKDAEREARANAIAQAVQQDRSDDSQDDAEEANARSRQAKAEKELSAWRRKVLKHGAGAEFKTEYIQPDIAAVIRARLACAANDEEVKAAYCGPFLVKQNSQAEIRLMRLLKKTFQGELDAALAILGDPPNLDKLTDAFWSSQKSKMLSVIRPQLETIALDAATDTILAMGIGVDWTDMATAVMHWAQGYSYSLVDGITATTQQVLREKVAQFLTEEGRTLADLVKDLSPWFGDVRAERIAITEVTRAVAEAQRIVMQRAAAAGFRLEPIWNTNNDDLVCPVCGPNHRKRQSDGWTVGWPPSHPSCRCWITLEWVVD